MKHMLVAGMVSIAVLGVSAHAAENAKTASVQKKSEGAVSTYDQTSPALTAEDSKTTIGEPRYLPLRWLSLGTSITWYNSHAGATFKKGYQ